MGLILHNFDPMLKSQSQMVKGQSQLFKGQDQHMANLNPSPTYMHVIQVKPWAENPTL